MLSTWLILIVSGWLANKEWFLSGKMFGNDDYMRLVQIRDWLGGQNWFDLHQKRLNPSDPLLSHWSRLSDVLIGGPIKILSPLLGQENAELFVTAAYPSLMLLVLLTLIFAIARKLDQNTIKPWMVALITVSALAVTSQFKVSRIDHHGLQMVIALLICWFLVQSNERPKRAAIAGLLSGVAIFVGLESAPFVAAACIAMGLIWVLKEGNVESRLKYFGIAMAMASIASLALFAPPSRWSAPQCDAISIVYVSLTCLVALAFCALSFLSRHVKTIIARFAVASILAIICLGITALLFPNCLKGPYAEIDPRLAEFWLANVSEVEPLHIFVKDHIYRGAAVAGLLLLSFCGFLAYCIKNKTGETDVSRTIFIFLFIPFLVSLYQIRSVAVATCFAIPYAAYALGRALAWTEKYGAPTFQIILKACIVILLNPVTAAMGFGILYGPDSSRETVKIEAGAKCTETSALKTLNQLPKGTALTQIDLGAPILKFTEHSVTSAPYHRNTNGILAALDMFTGNENQARDAVKRTNASYVIACRSLNQTKNQTRQAPDGMLAKLIANQTPIWLTKLDIGQGDDLLVYEVTLD